MKPDNAACVALALAFAAGLLLALAHREALTGDALRVRCDSQRQLTLGRTADRLRRIA